MARKNELIFKKTLKSQIDYVNERITKSQFNERGAVSMETYLLKEWLQSLQELDKICKERNRY